MIRFLADADLDNDIVLAVRRREPAVDFASAADGGIIGLEDPDVLEIAALQGRILVSHDRSTLPGHFRRRLLEGKESPGVFIVSQFEALGRLVEVLMTVWAVSDAGEWRNQVCHLPSLSRHLFRR